MRILIDRLIGVNIDAGVIEVGDGAVGEVLAALIGLAGRGQRELVVIIEAAELAHAFIGPGPPVEGTGVVDQAGSKGDLNVLVFLNLLDAHEGRVRV
jgi:hypothetical protein